MLVALLDDKGEADRSASGRTASRITNASAAAMCSISSGADELGTSAFGGRRSAIRPEPPV